jgi:hypothetical protein
VEGGVIARLAREPANSDSGPHEEERRSTGPSAGERIVQHMEDKA